MVLIAPVSGPCLPFTFQRNSGILSSRYVQTVRGLRLKYHFPLSESITNW